MQRSLAYAHSPPPALPLGFLLAAPWFGVLAALLLGFAGPGAMVSRWSAPILGATHLLTLGYLGMAMAGSMLQLIPVVSGTVVALGRAGAVLAWSALACGALLLAAALTFNRASLFLPAAALLLLAFAILIASVGRALVRPAPPAALPMVGGMRIAIAGLAVTVTLGALLALAFSGAAALPVLTLARLHAAWGLIGWVAMLVVCVAFQVIPMFQSSQTYPAAVTRWAPAALACLLLAWSTAAHAVLASAIAFMLTAFSVLSGWLIAKRNRKQADATTLYWRLSLGSLGAGALLSLLPSNEQLALLTGIVFIAGFALGAVNGMLYKIVPFLLWYHLQQDVRTKKGDVPPIRAIITDVAARRQFWWHCAAVAALAGAVFWPDWLLRPAAALFAIASARLALDVGRASLRCRAIQSSLQPS